MLKSSDTNVATVLARFASTETDVSLLVPTPTGLTKSIMDATHSVREFLREAGVHDYAKQGQGQENKRLLDAYFVHADGVTKTNASLYRPDTKKGDPRICFYRLKSYASAYNLLAITVFNGSLYVINCSRPDVLSSGDTPGTPLHKIINNRSQDSGGPAAELLEKIRAIANRGFVRTLRPGSTGVGMTLETMLGINANSSQAPDYKGIELKSGRVRGRTASRTTLFSQVPNWELSPVETAWNLLKCHGKDRDGVLKLYHEMTCGSPNSIGFYLELDRDQDWLKQCHKAQASKTTHLTTWEFTVLRRRLRDKHRETFWVKAACKGSGDKEEFHYNHVKHTGNPIIKNLEPLLESGCISVDYTMKQRADQERVRDHGYLFKMHPKDMPALFPVLATHEFS